MCSPGVMSTRWGTPILDTQRLRQQWCPGGMESKRVEDQISQNGKKRENLHKLSLRNLVFETVPHHVHVKTALVVITWIVAVRQGGVEFLVYC